MPTKLVICFRMRRSLQCDGGYDLFAGISRLLSEQCQLYVRHSWRRS